MRRIIFFILIFCILNIKMVYALEDENVIEVIGINNSQLKVEKPLKLDAQSVICIDMKTKRVLFSKNSNKRMAMASTTKIMTAILAIENCNLNEEVTISKRAANIGGSTIKLKTGEKIKLNDLLYGLMLRSGNDAAIATAEHVGGTYENFIEMMNKKALQLGLKDTFFVNPHGLDNEGHFTTAEELSMLTAYCLSNTTFAKIVSTVAIQNSKGSYYNTNELLQTYRGADGVKTGYTGQAGRCLVSSATVNGFKLITVVLNAPNKKARFDVSRKVLDYVYENYKEYSLINKGDKVIVMDVLKGVEKKVDVVSNDSLIFPLNIQEFETLTTEIIATKTKEAPIFKRDIVGQENFKINGKIVAKVKLISGKDIVKKDFMDYANELFTKYLVGIKMNQIFTNRYPNFIT